MATKVPTTLLAVMFEGVCCSVRATGKKRARPQSFKRGIDVALTVLVRRNTEADLERCREIAGIVEAPGMTLCTQFTLALIDLMLSAEQLSLGHVDKTHIQFTAAVLIDRARKPALKNKNGCHAMLKSPLLRLSDDRLVDGK